MNNTLMRCVLYYFDGLSLKTFSPEQNPSREEN